MLETRVSLFGKKYQLLHKLGEGGFAAVYLAKDTTLGRQVAIKVLNAQLPANDPAFLTRFEREAQIVAQLSHAHIIDVYEFGQDGDRYFIVMPYLPGPDLAHLLREKGPLPVDQVLRITEQVGSALDYAHSRDIIHRDVKPPNVIFNEQGQAILTDFGIVKLMDETTALTQTGGMIGTPFYMAPEQWAGQMDPRTDLYALGVMVYLMLTGKVPFSGETPPRIMYAHLNETPPPPHTLNSALPRTVEKVLAKMLAKSPEQRYSTAGEFYADLKTALTENRRKDEARLPSRNLYGVVLLGVIALLFILMGGGLFLWSGGQSSPAETTPAINEARLEIDGQAVSNDFQSVMCETSRRLEIKFLDADDNPVDAVDFTYNWRFEPDDPYNEDKTKSGNFATNYQVPCELENQTVTVEAEKDGKTFFTKSLLFDISR